MSVTIDSTNPRIIADNIRKLDDAVQSAASELPEVETTDAGKVLTVNASGKWAASDLPPYPVGNLDYSTTEQDTGIKWTDDKPVYKITLTGKTPAEGNAIIDNFPFDTIISMEGIVLSTAGDYYDFNKNVTLTGNKANNRLIIVLPATSYRDTDYIVTILYTKPAAASNLNASPDRALNTESELDAAPEPEAEPVLKKVTKKKTTTKEEE